jgi:hypothetical protein
LVLIGVNWCSSALFGPKIDFRSFTAILPNPGTPDAVRACCDVLNATERSR